MSKFIKRLTKIWDIEENSVRIKLNIHIVHGIDVSVRVFVYVKEAEDEAEDEAELEV